MRTVHRLLIVEDDALLCASLAALLAGQPSLELVAAVHTRRETLAVARRENLDIVVLDLGLPDGGGPELVRSLKALRPHAEVMVHTVVDVWDVVFEALRAGATSYLLKGATPREIVEAVDEVCRGGAPMSPSIARAVLRHLHGGTPPPDPISPRERAILRLVDAGRTYKEVAAALNISPNTVHSHVKNIYAALSADGRAAALASARRRGLL